MTGKKSVHKKTIITEVVEKKPTKKKATRKKTTQKSSSDKKDSNDKVEKILVENFISLQKVLTNLSIKFDDLSHNISKLLDLFEISAKALAEKDFDMGNKGEDRSGEIVDKLETVLDQNKIIARGLTLMHDKIDDGEVPQSSPLAQVPRPSLPRAPEGERKIGPKSSLEGYEKSIY